MDIKYSKRNSFFLLLASIFGFIALPLMGLDTFNLEIYNNFPIIPEAYVIYISYPIFYFGLIGCAVGINIFWKRIFNSNIVMKIDEDGFWADIDNQIDVNLKWKEIDSFRLKVRKVSGRYLEYLVINPKDISIAQRVNRLSGHDSSTAASFMKWTKKTLGKAATVGIYDPHKQIAIYLEGFQYKPEKIIMKMEEYYEENK